MSILTKPDILEQIAAGRIVFSEEGDPIPATRLCVGPNSVDLHLHPTLKVYQKVVLDARAENKADELVIKDQGLVLQPGRLYLARTVERTFTPHHVPKIGGRSSTGRLGINIHQTAGFGDVGFDGTWTLEISCVEPVRIYPRMRICQLWLFTVSTELLADEQYGGSQHGGRYQGQVDATEYRGHTDKE